MHAITVQLLINANPERAIVSGRALGYEVNMPQKANGTASESRPDEVMFLPVSPFPMIAVNVTAGPSSQSSYVASSFTGHGQPVSVPSAVASVIA